MARQWRIEYPGALYHVLSRGNGGQAVFLNDVDRSFFLSLLEELSARYQIELYAFVLMGNHYHLLLKTVEANLSTAMQWFGTTYSRKFNTANQLNGHLFQGRFKSIIVQNDAYLLRLSCYMHRNPVRAGLVERLADYPWSSYVYYAYKKMAPSWLKTDLILNQLSSGLDRRTAYRIMVQEYSDESGSIWEDVRHGLIIGSQDFVADIKARFLGESTDAELPQHNSLFREFDPVLLLNKACEVLAFDLASARTKSKIGRQEKDNRDLLIYLLWQAGRMSNYAIGEYFGLTYSAISRRVKIVHEGMTLDSRLRDRYETLKSQIKV